MNKVTIYRYDENKPVRALNLNGEPWFVLKDVCEVLGIKEKDFIGWLLDHKYVYRDQKNKLMPYAAKNNGLFEVKEGKGRHNDWAGTQTLITPKGRETFRLLCKELA